MKTIEDIVRERGGIWPFETKHENLYWDNYTETCFPFWYSGQITTYICTRTEFEECARRLRNDPKWADAPDWAMAVAQGANGLWYWLEDAPDFGDYAYTQDGRIHWAATGEVIGDWKQTLRLRPEEKKMEDKKQMNASEAVYGFASWLTCRKNKVCFSSTDDAGIAADLVREFCSTNALPGISDNWPNNLVHPEDKNDWHERGEFPPVGAVCEVLPYWHVCESIAPHQNGMVMYDRNNDEYFLATKNTRFRPPQTERKQLIERATRVVKDSRTPGDAVKLLTDAGMLKMPEDK